jgi:hypothetical protein
MGTNECAAKGVDAPSFFHLPSVLRRLPVLLIARFFLSVRPPFPLCCKKLRCAPITLTVTKAATIPVTGLKVVATTGRRNEVYGGQNTAFVTLSAGQTLTLPLTQ